MSWSRSATWCRATTPRPARKGSTQALSGGEAKDQSLRRFPTSAKQPRLSEIPSKWPTLVLLSVATLLGMSVWFSASAIAPQLTQLWQLDDSGRAGLTMSVQIGFVVGALGSSLLNLSDRLPARWMMSISSGLAALATALIAATTTGLSFALTLRFLTGVALAGVYPVGSRFEVQRAR